MRAVETTKDNSGIIVNFAFNYGGRDDILQAIRKVVREVQDQKIDINQVNEELFQHFLYTKEMPDPKILIHTVIEMRISDFILLISSTAIIYLIDVIIILYIIIL